MKWYVIVAVLSLLSRVRGEEESFIENSSNNEELRFKHAESNSTITPRKIRFGDPQFDEPGYTLEEQSGSTLRFEDHPSQESPGRVTFQDDNRVEVDNGFHLDNSNNPTRVTFQDNNKTEDHSTKKKRKRRRRKPRYQTGPYNPGPVPYGPGYPASSGLPYPGYGMAPGRPVGQYYRPPRRPQQSFASEALSKLTGALSSIALYDDYQCVPRLLCEAAGGGVLGGGVLGASPVLQSIAGLQPLLTLLSAYNGISTSPLFVFGRAVFLGMTSKGNTASCRYAYPQCPTDPEQLIHYLNNHNGGFFRFFNAPQPQIPQNVEQFYNQLSGQYGFPPPAYGLYDPSNQDPNPNQQYGFNHPQNPNYPQPDPQYQAPNPDQHYGFNRPHSYPQQSQGPQNANQQYGFYQQHPQNYYSQSFQNPGPNYNFYQQNPYPVPNQISQGNQYGLYNNPYSRPPHNYANQYNYANQNYGSVRPHGNKYGNKNVRYKDNNDEAQRRIQNKPTYLYIDSDVGNVDVNTKWIFPENSIHAELQASNNIRDGKGLKFPEENIKISNNYNREITDSTRKGKSIIFPESQNIRYVNYYDYPHVTNDNFNYNYQNDNIGTGNAANYDHEKNIETNYGHIYGNVNDSNRYGNNFKYYNIDYNANRYVNSNAYSKYMYNSEDEDGVQTVYIVRGNGDPNHPEIIKVRPGEKVML